MTNLSRRAFLASSGALAAALPDPGMSSRCGIEITAEEVAKIYKKA